MTLHCNAARRRHLCLRAAAAIAWPVATVQAADFPANPIRFVVPCVAGGTTNLVAPAGGQNLDDVARKAGMRVD